MNTPKTDDEILIQRWSKLTGERLTLEEARDLELTFSGAQDPMLGAEPHHPIQNNDEPDDETVVAPKRPILSRPPSDSSRKPVLSRDQKPR